MRVRALEAYPLHLGIGGTAAAQPRFYGPDWFEAYAERTRSDGGDGRLVTLFSFSENWESWEMHPAGDEVVLCIEGRFTLHQELADGASARLELGPGEYAINPPGCWHTADVDGGTATALFITVGVDTAHRPR